MLPEPEVCREISMSESVVEDSLLIAHVLVLLLSSLWIVLFANHLFLLIDLGFQNHFGSLLLYKHPLIFAQLLINAFFQTLLHNLLILWINNAVFCKRAFRFDMKVTFAIRLQIIGLYWKSKACSTQVLLRLIVASVRWKLWFPWWLFVHNTGKHGFSTCYAASLKDRACSMSHTFHQLSELLGTFRITLLDQLLWLLETWFWPRFRLRRSTWASSWKFIDPIVFITVNCRVYLCHLYSYVVYCLSNVELTCAHHLLQGNLTLLSLEHFKV